MPAASQRICFPLFCCRQRLWIINKQQNVSQCISKIGCKDAGIWCADWHSQCLYTRPTLCINYSLYIAHGQVHAPLYIQVSATALCGLLLWFSS